MQQTLFNLQDTMEEAGHRLTSARLDLLSAIADRPEGFTAEELYEKLPTVGRATVYRTLKLLIKLGLVCKAALPDGAPRYTLAGPGHHHHAVCIQCGTISEFQRCTVDSILQALSADTKGTIVGHRIEVYVLCQSCSSLENASATGATVL